MSDAGFFRGDVRIILLINCSTFDREPPQKQDNRFTNKDKKLMKEMKFAECLTKKVDMTKVKLEVIKPWVTEQITGILGMEDDVIVDYVFNQLDAEKK
ncbi:Serine/arginine repetitive matrix protein 1 [Armadillidium nasatum]|uniref:Serine/arginine repetitive matrix protein 1 n=1 Tax=Armadillidium nasatum TaxID=96803 RepID=A0A5N5TJQ2_9CRUS|nr:Serine/arginine repetitive matrix protein 1 [Armadillidium nasatum]